MSEVVLAYPSKLINHLLPEGYSGPAFSREEFGVHMLTAAVWESRAVLKARAEEKQAIDYSIFIHPVVDPEEADTISLYQRAKTVGEEKLMGNFSIGYGGHVDQPDRVVDADGYTLFVPTLNASHEREVRGEEITVTGPATQVEQVHIEQQSAHAGWINDNSNAIGQIHFAAVTITVLPYGSIIASNEPNQVIQKPVTLAELQALENKESWTAILAAALAPYFNAKGKFIGVLQQDESGIRRYEAPTEFVYTA
jgi:predicted NUDIX family phosphoesterase